MGRLEEINEELSALRERISSRRALRAKVDDLEGQRRALRDKLSDLDAERYKEEADVERLEKPSLTSLLQTILGEKEERLKRERQEALAAQLKCEAAQASLKDVECRLSAARGELCGLDANERRYEELLREKGGLLTDPAAAERIRALEEKAARCAGIAKESGEAISVGNQVLDALHQASSDLGSAEGWGICDMLGGGLLATAVKHSHIDDARNSAYEASRLMSRFRTELADVKMSLDFDFQDDGFLNFADYFFDGLLADWFVQRGIEDSARSVDQNRGKVVSVMRKLVQLKNEAEADRAQAEQELRTLLEQA